MDFINELNVKQYEAVTSPYRHIRIVAGAGSGKTRVLTYRIAYLISELMVKPWSILAITFTNKVAAEMKSRIVKMIPECEKDLTIKTFHSFAAMFLRREIENIGFPATFSILDEEDQTKLVKDIAAELGFKRSDKIVSRTISYISSNKLKEKYPDDIHIDVPKFEDEKTCLEIYTRYEEQKQKLIALDFDDLLLKANYILEHFPDIRIKWQNKIDHILIDEFQDTNNVEYKFISLLRREDAYFYVVGDPDQTIYTWRGANQDIILGLEKKFSDLNTIILEENYRSTSSILNSANKLISHNKLRVPKNLFTSNGTGDPITVRNAPSGKLEADFVAREIKKLVQIDGFSYEDIAILYRASYVTLDFESAFTTFNIPYIIYGGVKFYARKEIKDVLAYFHLLNNVKDDLSFERIINVPKRGIGDASINLIKKEASDNNSSMYEYIRTLDEANNYSELPKRVITTLKSMILAIDLAREAIENEQEVFSKTIEDMIWSFGFMDYLMKEENGDERIENIKALFSDIRHFLQSNPEATFDEYLQNIALLSSQDDIIDGNHVKMMTVHTAKGLEFPVVFVVRLNDGVFPHARALLENGYLALEEERRLAYVAMTRAKKKLYLTISNDFNHVINGYQKPSQFLKESGNEVVTTNTEYNPFKSSNKQSTYKFDDGPHLSFDNNAPIRQDFENKTNGLKESDFKVGDIVYHKKFGRGKVTCLEGDGIITVNFDEHGTKSVMCNHPSISKGENLA